MADETIIIQYVIDAAKAYDDIDKMRSVINNLKSDLRGMVADGKASFKDIERTLISSLRGMSQAADKTNLANFLKINPDELQGAKAFEEARKQAIEAVKIATQELQAEQKNATAEAKRDQQEYYAEQQRLAQQASQLVREISAKEKADRQEYVTKTAQGWKTMSEGAREYGRQVEAIKQQLYQMQLPMGADYQDAGVNLIKKGADVETVTQAIKELAQEEKALADLRKKTLAEQLQAQTQYEERTKQGFGQMSEAAKQYGQAVQAIKNSILAQAQASGQTYQQIAQQMSQAGVAANVLKTALGEIKTQEEATAKATAEAKQAEIRAMREYEQVTKRGYNEVMSPAAAAFGQQVAQVKAQIQQQAQATGQTFGQIAQQMQSAGTSSNVLNTAMRELGASAKNTTTAFQSLGNVVTNVFIIGLGVNVFNILRQIISLFLRAAESGYELTKAFFQLEVGIRALRRAGIDITTQEMLDNLDKLSAKFGVFSKKDLVEGSAALANLIRSMGLTKSQIFELQEAIATLAVVNGRSMEDVQRTVALALASGYTEGLQRLGVSINRVNIAARAASMGFAEGYLNLSEYERSAATLSLILEKTALYADDLAKYQETLAGQYDILIAKQKDQKALMGQELLPLQVEYNKSLLHFYETLTEILSGLGPLISLLLMLRDTLMSIQQLDFTERLGGIGKAIKVISDGMKLLFAPLQIVLYGFQKLGESMQLLKDMKAGFWSENFFGDLIGGVQDLLSPLVSVHTGFEKVIDVLEGFKTSIRDITLIKAFENGLKGLADGLEKIFSLQDKKVFDQEIPVGTPDLDTDKMDDSIEKMRDHVTDLYEDIQRETRNYNNRMDELFRDLNRDLEAIDRDFVRDMLELWRDYQRDKAKIIEDGNRKAQKENDDYARDLGKVDRDYQNRIADENRDYQDDLADAALDFQRDQEEAERKYRLRQEEAERKYKEDQIQAEIDYQERLRKLREGFLFDLEDALRERDARQVLNLTRRYNMERDEAARDYQNEQDERARRFAAENEERARQFALENAERIRQFQAEQAEREREHQQRLADMAREREERLAEMALEHQQRLEEIRAETAAELEERRIAYEQEKEDRERKREEDKADRQLRYQEQLEELRISHEQRLREIVAALATEQDMTAQMLNRIGLQYRALYGPNGQIEGYIRYYIGMLNALALQQQRIMASASAVPIQYQNRYPGTMQSVGTQAEGGTYYADRPTHAVFGEAGPEIAQFTPLNGSRRTSITAAGSRENSPDGKIALRISLEQGLIAQIEENTLNRTADILMEVQRSTR